MQMFLQTRVNVANKNVMQISRTGNFGKSGASGGEFFEEHIGSIKVWLNVITMWRNSMLVVYFRSIQKLSTLPSRI